MGGSSAVEWVAFSMDKITKRASLLVGNARQRRQYQRDVKRAYGEAMARSAASLYGKRWASLLTFDRSHFTEAA